MLTYKDLKVIENKLYYFEEDTGYGICPHEEIPNMWRIVFFNGNKSNEFYNLHTACDNLKKYYQHKINSGRKPEEALPGVFYTQ